MSAIAAAAVGASVLLPATAQGQGQGQGQGQARAQAQIPICPHVVGLCTWTEPNSEGRVRMLPRAEPQVNPPVRSAKNQTSQTWCLYPRPSYAGRAVVLPSGSYTPGLGLTACSVRPC